MSGLINRNRVQKANWLHLVAILAWLVLVATSGWITVGFDGKKGTVGKTPDVWPAQSKLKKAHDVLTLLMFVHPRCPCSRASVRELEKMVCRAQGRIAAKVVFLSYAGNKSDWQKTALWDDARAIPGVTLVTDFNGEEASLFGAQTSGQTLLYDEAGKLLFQGGITASRGHEGGNVGEQAIEDLAFDRQAGCSSNLVFGCPLFNNGDL